jgi:hypothetical protein
LNYRVKWHLSALKRPLPFVDMTVPGNPLRGISPPRQLRPWRRKRHGVTPEPAKRVKPGEILSGISYHDSF